MRSLVLMTPEKGWAASAKEALLPGAHVIALGRADVGIQGRLAGFEVRDTVAIVSPGAVRFGFLLRKPCVESTVAAQVLSTGTGVINVDGCRVSTSSADAKAMERCNTPGSGRMFDSSSPIGTFIRSSSSGPLDTSKGRWPSNLVFVHGPECREAGKKKVKSQNPQYKTEQKGRLGDSSAGYDYGNGKITRPVGTSIGFADADGTETVISWVCEPGCPVKALDEQSGQSKSSGGPIKQSGSSWKCSNQTGVYDRLVDSGGASRFYPQFRDDQELEAWLTKLINPPV